jgi:hypothetical protein
VFQDGARPLDVTQVAVLLCWTKDAVRAACERGELTHSRDHLNAYRIPCSAVTAAARSTPSNSERSRSGRMRKTDKPPDPVVHGITPKP